MSAAARPEVAGVVGVATQTGVAFTDLGQVVVRVDEVVHGASFRWGWDGMGNEAPARR